MTIRPPRVLSRSPAFAALAISALALVMGLSTTIVGIVDGLLYPRYPVREQSQLYYLEFFPPSSVVRNAAQLADARRAAAELVASRATFFEGATNSRLAGPLTLEANGRMTGTMWSTRAALNYFDLLGVTPAHGRFFRPGDADAIDNFAVISDNAWRALSVDGEVFKPFRVRNAAAEPYVSVPSELVVVGVMPRGSEGAARGDVLIASDLTTPARNVGTNLLVRARSGVDRGAIEAELGRLNVVLAQSHGTSPDESAFALRSITRTAPPAQRLYLALVASAIAILLVAGANLANVQLARGMVRRGELAIRMALGASRNDLVRLLTWESAQLALMGAVAGLVLSIWGMKLASAALPEGIPGMGIMRPQLSWRVLAFAGAAAAVSIATVGLLPAISLSRFDLTNTIKWGAGSGMVRSRNRRYAALVVAQIAVSLALAVGAALVVDAAAALHRLPFGFDVRPLAGVAVRAPGQWRTALVHPTKVVSDLRAVPGVQSAAVFRHFHYDSSQVTIETGFGDMSVFPMPSGSFIGRWVTPDFFRTLGVQMVEGTDFPSSDGVPAVIVDSIAAAQIWKGTSPVGRMIRFGGTWSRRPFVRVVGVAPHLRWDVGLYGDAVYDLQIYYTGPSLGTLKPDFLFGTAVVRGTEGSVAALALRNHFRDDPTYIRPAAWRSFVGLERTIQTHDVLSLIFGGLAVLALLLAATGVYSVVAYSVACRRREMGVRMALGASRERIFLMVVSEENLTTLLGLALGLLAADKALILVNETIFSTAPGQQMAVMIGATIGMFVVALLAAGVPGMRASRVSPAEALRAD